MEKVNVVQVAGGSTRRIAVSEIVRRLQAEARMRVNARTYTQRKAEPPKTVRRLQEEYKRLRTKSNKIDQRMRRLGWYPSGSKTYRTGDPDRVKFDANQAARTQKVHQLCTSALIELSVMDKDAVVPFLKGLQRDLARV